ncbi:hypothetical protein C8J56DRAFT_1029246 [Mycena floridula]|nr:hypothetical protein C8J56DRAFT_1029246 [Mycena floridula]
MGNNSFDAYVPTKTTELLALSTFQPKYVPFKIIHDQYLELERAFESTYLYSKRMTTPETFRHSQRLIHYGLALLHAGFPQNTPGVAQISSAELSKRFYLAAIMHDLAITTDHEALSHPAHAMSFELHGAIMAYDHLHQTHPELDAVQVGDVAQSIALHTIDFPMGTSSATAWLLQNSAIIDIVGYDAFGPGSLDTLWNKETIAEIEQAFPRGSFREEFNTIRAREQVEKPNCIMSHTRFWTWNL